MKAGAAEERDKLVAEVVALAPHMEIAHHVPGRIRLKVLPSGISKVQESEGEAAASSLPGVRSLRVNPFARSLVIEYAPSTIPPALWNRLARLRSHPEDGPEVARELRALWDAARPGA